MGEVEKERESPSKRHDGIGDTTGNDDGNGARSSQTRLAEDLGNAEAALVLDKTKAPSRLAGVSGVLDRAGFVLTVRKPNPLFSLRQLLTWPLTTITIPLLLFLCLGIGRGARRLCGG